ncbi:hypothetical protein CQ011_17365 [Arthrobacter sp. MYb213]|nr:hypothetical protein CQ011_17365 [Arthrobacter sp. MYb213]
MKKTFKAATLSSLAVLALLTSSCAGNSSSPVEKVDFPEGSTMAEIAQAGKIKLGASPNQPGLAELNLQQEWEGFNMDLAEYLAGTLGIEADNIEWVQTTAANRIPFIEQGKIDMFVTALAMTPEREETINISGPYLKTSPQLIVRKGDAEKMQTLEQIPKGTKVCVLQGSQGQPRVAEEIPQAEIVEFNVLTNCVRALEQGTADAVDSTAPLLAGFVEEKPDVFEFTPIKYGEEERWGIGMAKDRSDLCEYLNEKLNEAFDDGSIVKMWDEHMGKSGLEAPAKPEEMTGC